MNHWGATLTGHMVALLRQTAKIAPESNFFFHSQGIIWQYYHKISSSCTLSLVLVLLSVSVLIPFKVFMSEIQFLLLSSVIVLNQMGRIRQKECFPPCFLFSLMSLFMRASVRETNRQKDSVFSLFWILHFFPTRAAGGVWEIQRNKDSISLVLLTQAQLALSIYNLLQCGKDSVCVCVCQCV